MSSRFDLAIPVILRHEGGYANNPNDPGGATNYGISLRWLKAQGHDIGDFTQDGNVNVEDIKTMTKDNAVELYRSLWWDRFGIGQFSYQPLATKFFDGAVNMGVVQITKLLQRTLIKLGAIHLVVDGKFGQQTLIRANAYTNDQNTQAKETVEALAYTEVDFYRGLADAKPAFHEFLNGWVKRALEIDYTCA